MSECYFMFQCFIECFAFFFDDVMAQQYRYVYH